MAEEENLEETVIEETGQNGDAESEMDSLMSEMEAKQSAEEPSGSGDLSTLVTDTVEKEPQDLDTMLSSAQDVTIHADEDEEAMPLEYLLEMPLTVTFEVGRAKMTISDLLSLGQGSVLELHRLVGETLDMFVNNRLIARGEVVVINERFGARLTEIIAPEERIKRMGGMDKVT